MKGGWRSGRYPVRHQWREHTNSNNFLDRFAKRVSGAHKSWKVVPFGFLSLFSVVGRSLWHAGRAAKQSRDTATKIHVPVRCLEQSFCYHFHSSNGITSCDSYVTHTKSQRTKCWNNLRSSTDSWSRDLLAAPQNLMIIADIHFYLSVENSVVIRLSNQTLEKKRIFLSKKR